MTTDYIKNTTDTKRAWVEGQPGCYVTVMATRTGQGYFLSSASRTWARKANAEKAAKGWVS